MNPVIGAYVTSQANEGSISRALHNYLLPCISSSSVLSSPTAHSNAFLHVTPLIGRRDAFLVEPSSRLLRAMQHFRVPLELPQQKRRRQHLLLQLPWRSFAPDPILGQRPRYRSSRSLDSSRPVVSHHFVSPHSLWIYTNRWFVTGPMNVTDPTNSSAMRRDSTRTSRRSSNTSTATTS